MSNGVGGGLGRAQPCPLVAFDSVSHGISNGFDIDYTPERITSAGWALIPDEATEHRGATVKLMTMSIGVLLGTSRTRNEPVSARLLLSTGSR